jgi:hypothetical protein
MYFEEITLMAAFVNPNMLYLDFYSARSLKK